MHGDEKIRSHHDVVPCFRLARVFHPHGCGDSLGLDARKWELLSDIDHKG